MKKHIVLILILLSSLLMSSTYAVRVNSIYQAGIKVASQSEEARVAAEPAALAQVLVKVSGNSHVLDNADLKASLSKAGSLMEEFSYTPSPSTPATPYILNIRFDAESVNRLLRNASMPIWGQNRPLILAWMEYEVPSKPAEIIESDSQGDVHTSLKEQADQRGLPIIFPVMDVTDLNQVNVNDVVTMTLPTLQNASKRYTSDAILIARIFKLQTGFSIQSRMIMGTQQWTWNISGKSLDEVMTGLVNNIADTLAGRYAAVITNNVQTQITLKVVGITQQTDLAQLMQYVTHLTPVADVEPLQITSSEVNLKVSLRGSKDAFIQALSVGQKLQPASGSTDTVLVYQWTP